VGSGVGSGLDAATGFAAGLGVAALGAGFMSAAGCASQGNSRLVGFAAAPLPSSTGFGAGFGVGAAAATFSGTRILCDAVSASFEDCLDRSSSVRARGGPASCLLAGGVDAFSDGFESAWADADFSSGLLTGFSLCAFCVGALLLAWATGFSPAATWFSVVSAFGC